MIRFPTKLGMKWDYIFENIKRIKPDDQNFRSRELLKLVLDFNNEFNFFNSLSPKKM